MQLFKCVEIADVSAEQTEEAFEYFRHKVPGGAHVKSVSGFAEDPCNTARNGMLFNDRHGKSVFRK